jgi:riboflavin synthase
MKKSLFEVEYMPETLVKTTVGSYKKGVVVNLERSLKMSDLLDGHIVQGHVDCVGKIVNVKAAGESKVMKISVPVKFKKFIAPKGSVAIDGISLTVVDTGKDWLAVSLVSYTLENTNLRILKIGDKVNIETDVLAKYVYNILNTK